MMSARAHAYVCRMRVAAATMLLLAAYAALGQSPASRTKQTPSDDDIPKPLPIQSSLAGDAQPDISRFLNVRAASAPAPSPDGVRLAVIGSSTVRTSAATSARAII
jgi:hypothetical protein